MNSLSFLKRLENGKVNNLLYSSDCAEGLVAVWKHEMAFILTWEECRPGKQFDESEYLRDERRVFTSAEELLEFLQENSLPLESFAP